MIPHWNEILKWWSILVLSYGNNFETLREKRDRSALWSQS